MNAVILPKDNALPFQFVGVRCLFYCLRVSKATKARYRQSEFRGNSNTKQVNKHEGFLTHSRSLIHCDIITDGTIVVKSGVNSLSKTNYTSGDHKTDVW
jgi:hypothetical protein